MKPALEKNFPQGAGVSPEEFAREGELWRDSNRMDGGLNPWHKNLDDVMFYL